MLGIQRIRPHLYPTRACWQGSGHCVCRHLRKSRGFSASLQAALDLLCSVFKLRVIFPYWSSQRVQHWLIPLNPLLYFLVWWMIYLSREAGTPKSFFCLPSPIYMGHIPIPMDSASLKLSWILWCAEEGSYYQWKLIVKSPGILCSLLIIAIANH